MKREFLIFIDNNTTHGVNSANGGLTADNTQKECGEIFYTMCQNLIVTCLIIGIIVFSLIQPILKIY